MKLSIKKLSDLCRKAGDVDNAIKAFDELIILEPEQPTWHVRRGDYFLEAKDYDNAIREYVTAIKLVPTNKEIPRQILDFYFQKRDLPSFNRSEFYKAHDKNRIAKAFTDLINGDPNNPELYKLRGDFYKEVNDVDNAVKDYSSAIKFAPNDSYSLKQLINLYEDIGKQEKITQLYDEIIKRAPDNVDLRKRRGTIEYYTHLISLQPNDKSLYTTRAELYAERADYDNALADYAKALEIDPRFFECYEERAKIYVKKEDYVHAIEEYTRLAEINPGYIYGRAFYERSWLYEKLGEYDKAFADLDNAFVIDGKSNHDMVGFNPSLHKSDVERILKNLYKADVPVAPESLNSKYICEYCGKFYQSKGRNDIAIKCYTRAIELNPNNDNEYLAADMYLARGGIYQSDNKHNLAIKDYTRVLEIAPNSSSLQRYYLNALFERAYSYLQLNDSAKALADLNKLLEMNPNYHSYAYNNRGVAYENLGDLDKALADYNKALELASNNELAKNNRQRVLDKMKK